jgi:hypothetical protein
MVAVTLSWIVWMAMAASAGESTPVTAPTTSAPASRPTTGPATQDTLEQQAGRFFREGVRSFRQEKYAQAALNLRVCLELRPSGPLADQARRYLDNMEQEARSRLGIARDLVDRKQYLTAETQFQDVAESFAGLEVAGEAERALLALRQRPEYVRARREEEARALLPKAQAHEPRNEYFAACSAYRQLAETYPETAAGQAARKRLTEIEADPKLAALVQAQKADREAANWLALADNYRQSATDTDGAARTRFILQSRDYYNRILAAYPTSPQAAEAKRGLAELVLLEKPPST